MKVNNVDDERLTGTQYYQLLKLRTGVFVLETTGARISVSALLLGQLLVFTILVFMELIK